MGFLHQEKNQSLTKQSPSVSSPRHRQEGTASASPPPFSFTENPNSLNKAEGKKNNGFEEKGMKSFAPYQLPIQRKKTEQTKQIEPFELKNTEIQQSNPSPIQKKEYSGKGELGELSAKYESNGNPGTVSTGRGDRGGVSYGSYQMASKLGVPEEFLNHSSGQKYKKEFGDSKSGSAEFSKVWKAISTREADAFQKAQHDYIKTVYYDKFSDNLKENIDLNLSSRSQVLKDVAWSTSVQHGSNNNVFSTALAGKDLSNMTDQDIIKAVYAERGKTDANGNLSRFSRNSAEVQSGVKSRFISEQNLALNAMFPDSQRKLSGIVKEKKHTATDLVFVQNALKQLGHLTDADIKADIESGSNIPKTVAAIKAFQNKHKSVLGEADGVVGKDSERMLITLTGGTAAESSNSLKSNKVTTSTSETTGNSSPNLMETTVLGLYNAMNGWGTDEKEVYKLLTSLSGNQKSINTLNNLYQDKYGMGIEQHLRSEFSNTLIFGNELEKALSLININDTKPSGRGKRVVRRTSKKKNPKNRANLGAAVGKGKSNQEVDVRIVQQLLNKSGAQLEVDGIAGDKTFAAIGAYQSSAFDWKDGVVDPGGKTLEALAKGEVQIKVAPKFEAPTKSLSISGRPTYDQLTTVYGDPESYDYITKIAVPFPLFYGGSPVSSLRVHKDVAVSLSNALSQVLSHYGLEELKSLRIGDNYGGTLNKRKMRGGSSWSTHSWGVAIDLNASENQLSWGSDKALFAKKEYKPLLDIMERNGWYNLGRYKNYDYMHFQAVKI